MSHTKNSPQQHRRIVRIPSGGTAAHNSSAAAAAARASPGALQSPISSLPNALVGVVDYRSSDVQALENSSCSNSSYRWQVARGGGGVGSPSPSPTWPNVNTTTSESSAGYGSPALDTISAVYSEILDNSIRNAEGGQPQRFSPAVASALSGGSPEFGFVASRSPSVGGGPLASNTSSLSLQAWNSTGRDLSSLTHAVELSKAGFALPGALVANSVRSPTIAANAAQSSARFSASSGLNFVERAARFSSFGNGSFSPSPFPLPENGNARALASVESGMAVSSNGGVSRSNDLGQDSFSGNPGAYHIASADQRVASGGKENLGRSEQARVFAASTGSIRSEWDGGEEEEGNAEKRERGSSDFEDSESSPEQQETSCGEESGAATRLMRKRKKSASSEQERHENETSSSLKERKGVDGSSKRFKDSRGGGGKEESKEKGEGANGKKNPSSSNSAAASNDAAKNAEQPPKLDYIHVRARRGQATDSHSLAERVRREKISERMKFLQDLVPGCSKVTGKAGMLDEIINYVQSIQRQVEFLSMKLASVAPRPDFNPEVVLNKHLPMGSAYGHTDLLDHSEKSLPLTQVEPQQVLQVPARVNSLDFQPSTAAADMNVWRTIETPASLPRNPVHSLRIGGSTPQTPSRWDGDLHSVVQMGIGQGTHVGYRQTGHQSDFPPGRMT